MNNLQSETKRIFVGIPVPKDVISRIQMLKTLVNAPPDDIRWIFGKNLHITLSFLGHISDGNLDEVVNCLAKEVKQSAFDLTISGTGVFPDNNNPRIYWMDIEKGRDELIALQAEIDKSVDHLKQKPGIRPYVPHVSIGRSIPKSKPWTFDIEHFLNAEYDVVKIAVNHIYLYMSELLPTGARYTMLKDFSLK